MATPTDHQEPTPQQWEQVKPRIKQLYLEEGRPLPHVRRELEKEGFSVKTDKPFKTRFRKWGWQKNGSHSHGVGKRRAPIARAARPVRVPDRTVHHYDQSNRGIVIPSRDGPPRGPPQSTPAAPPTEFVWARTEQPHTHQMRTSHLSDRSTSWLQPGRLDFQLTSPVFQFASTGLTGAFPTPDPHLMTQDSMNWDYDWEISVLLLDIGETRCSQPLHLAAKNGHVDTVQWLLREGHLVDALDTEGVTPLSLAAQEGHSSVVRALLAKNANPNLAAIDSGRQPLHQAAQNGHTSVVMILVENMDDVDKPAQGGETPLWLAAQSGDRESVLKLLDRNASPDTPAVPSGNRPLHQAAQKGHTEVVQKLMDKVSDIEAKTKDGITPLWYAAQAGDVRSVKCLLERGASADTSTKKEGRCPLHQAIQNKHRETIKTLMSRVSNIEAVTKDGVTALLLAAELGLEEVVQVLMDRDANLNATYKDSKRSALHQAAQNGFFKIVKILLSKGAEVNGVDANGKTALFLASENGHIRVVQALLVSQANPDIPSTDQGRHAIHQATDNGHKNVVELLLNHHHCEINCVDFDGVTPVMLAAKSDDRASITALLQRGADPNLGCKEGQRALHWTLGNESTEILQMLLEAGARPEPIVGTGLVPLMIAALRGDWKSAACLLSYKVDVNQKSGEGRTPLHASVWTGSWELVNTLLKHGAQVDAKDFDGVTPLMIAAQQGNFAAVQALLDAQADPMAKTIKGHRQALHQAAQYGQTVVVKKLVEVMSDIHVPDMDGETPLYLAASRGHNEIVATLLGKGADPNSPCVEIAPLLPLHSAARSGFEAIVKQLLDKGAEVDVLSERGETPLWHAAEKGRATVVQLLLHAGAKPNVVVLDGRHPLHQAAQGGNHDVVRQLLDAGAEPDRPDEDGSTPLLLAAVANDYHSAKALLDKGANPNVYHHATRISPLFTAAGVGSMGLVSLLIHHKASIDAPDSDNATPLWMACQEGHKDVVQALLNAGADPNLRSTDFGRLGLHQAAAGKHGEVVRSLLDSGKVHNIDLAGDDGETPLWLAAASGDKVSFAALLSQGADPDVSVKSLKTRPIHLVSQYGYTEMLKALVGQIADVDVTDREGRTPLLSAADNGHDEAVEVLLAKGANPNVCIWDLRRRPIHQAAEGGHSKVVELLIKSGAEVDARDEDGYTPLILAGAKGDRASIAALLAAGASPNAFDNTLQRRALHLAALGGFTEAVQLILKNTAEADVPAKEGETPLWLAVQSGDVESVREFLSRDANPNVVEKTTGSHVLHLAAEKGLAEVVEALLDRGAHIDKATSEGMTPLMLASQENHLAVVNLLLERRADINQKSGTGGSAMTIAAEKGHLEILRRLSRL